MLRASRKELVGIPLAVTEAAPTALGARLAEDSGLGFDDPHGAEFPVAEMPAYRAGCQWGLGVKVPAGCGRRWLRLLQR